MDIGKTAGSGQQTTLTRVGEYNEIQPKNVKYPTVPIISMSRERYADSNGTVPDAGNALRADAIRRARRRLQLDQNPAAYIPAGNVTRNGEEYVLKVTKASLNKMLSPAEEKVVPLESILVLDNLERIANNGVWKKSEGDWEKRQQIRGFDHLMTTVYIDNEPYVVDLRVRLVREAAGKETDNVLYYFTPEEIMSVKKADASSPTVQRRRAAHGFRDSASTTDKVAQTAPVVNAAGTATQPAEPTALRRAVQSACDAGRVNVPVTALELDDPDLEAAYFAGRRERIMTGEEVEEDAKPVENVWKQDYTEYEKLQEERFRKDRKESPVFKTVIEHHEIDDDSDTWNRKRIAAAHKYALSDMESKGIGRYVGGDAYEWTSIQRGESKYERTEYTDFLIQQAYAAFQKMPTYAGRAYRNIVFFSSDAAREFMKKYAVGNEVVIDAFTSASKDPNGYVVTDGHVIHLVIDGASARDIADNFGIPSQQEVVYMPGTVLRVDLVTEANDGNALIYVQEVK